jgi:hypothetical protein
MSITRIPVAGGQDSGNRWGPHSVIILGLDKRREMHFDTEKAAIGVMTIVIAGIGPACVALLLLL